MIVEFAFILQPLIYRR